MFDTYPERNRGTTVTEMTPEPAPHGRVSISREVLRAELAEMELRLRIWISAELEEKASAVELAELKGEFAAKAAWADGLMPLRDNYIKQLEQVVAWRDSAQAGRFTEAQQAAIAMTAKNVLQQHENAGWTKRERMFAFVAITCTLIVSAINIAEAGGFI